MKPHADFHCDTCSDTYDLPVAATVCPVCQGPIERVWTPPQIAPKNVRGYLDPMLATLPRKLDGPSREVLERRAMDAMPNTNAGLLLKQQLQQITVGKPGNSHYKRGEIKRPTVQDTSARSVLGVLPRPQPVVAGRDPRPLPT